MDVAARIASIDSQLDRLPPSRPVCSWIARVSFGAVFEIYEIALTGLLGPLPTNTGGDWRDDGPFTLVTTDRSIDRCPT